MIVAFAMAASIVKKSASGGDSVVELREVHRSA